MKGRERMNTESLGGSWGCMDLCSSLGFFQGRNGTKAARNCGVSEGPGPGMRKSCLLSMQLVAGTQVFVTLFLCLYVCLESFIMNF